MNKIKEVCFSREWMQFRVENGSNGQRDFLINYIEKLPSITSLPKTAQWISTGSGQECSRCGEIQYGYDNFRRFCAYCGAKMESEG